VSAVIEDTAVTAPPGTKRHSGPGIVDLIVSGRREVFERYQDLSRGVGLEIGPLDSPIAQRPDCDVRYVDVHDRAGLQAHYADNYGVILEMIPEIDFPLIVDGESRSLLEAASPGGPYDWVIASHVIEHVPDVIGWLEQLAEMTVDHGRLLLIVPDRRYSFDRRRPATTTGQALEAYERGDTRPGTRALFDHFGSAVGVNTAALRAGGRPPGVRRRIHDLAYVQDKLERARAGEYVDAHVWTFTPRSLVELLTDLRAMGLCPWRTVAVEDRPGTLEFAVVLERNSREAGAPEPDAVDLDAPPGWWLDDFEPMDERIARLRDRNSRLRERSVRRAERIRALRAKVRTLRSELAHARSGADRGGSLRRLVGAARSRLGRR
jgi:hypothetical protein